ncbi:glycosyltransferase [Serinicoccus marinus]|uniref:glycosyltransferase n=1 Tax=Serinicoccus marinus TaxID=247333 RepID=UPI001930FFBD|nr:glycosyltransferase [Serinicoccus marinus]
MVDVSVEIAVLVRLCGVPVVLGGMPGDREDQPHRLARSLAEAVLAPWPPGAHGDGAASGPAPRTWEVGGISALAVAGGASGEGSARPGTGQGEPGALPAGSGQGATGAVEPGRGPLGAVEPRRGGVLVVWGSGGAGPGEHDVEAARASTGRRWLVRGGDHPPSPDLLAEMRAAEVVVCHAGQGAVADVALAGRPAVVLAQPRPHGEQEATARALERRGLAATASGWPAAEAWPGLLDRALATGGEGWSAWGSQQGAARAAQCLDEAATRLQEQRCWPS